jgi:branched-chain amino acid transport system substrate-binding protein
MQNEAVRKPNQRTFLLTYGMIVLLAGVISFGAPALVQAEAKPIKIGVVHSLSGPAGSFGRYYKEGAGMAAKEINAQGGILGRPIEYIFRDDRANPEAALREARSLFMQKEVDFLIGGVVSSCTLAILPLSLERKKIFMIDIAGATDNTLKGHRYSFASQLSSPAQGRATARYVAEKRPDLKKWYIMGPDYAYGHDIYKWFWDELKRLNPSVEVVGEAWPKFGTSEFGPYVTTIMAAKPDAVFSSVWGGDFVNWLKAAVPRKFHEHIVEVGAEKAQLENLMPPGDLLPDGLIENGPFPFWAIDTPGIKKWLSDYHDATGNLYPSTSVQNAYMHAYLLKAAIEKAGKVETEAVVDALEGMTLNGPAGKLVVNPATHVMMLPQYVGVTKRVPEYPFSITVDVKAYPGEEVNLTAEEFNKLRNKK